MLKIRYRGLTVLYPNHKDLITPEIDKLYREIEDQVRYLENVKESGYSYLQLDDKHYFVLYNEPKLSQKEHLYIYSTEIKDFVKEVHYKVFEKLFEAKKFIKFKINEIGKGKQREYDLIPNIKNILFEKSLYRIQHKEEIIKQEKAHIIKDLDKYER